MMKNELDSQFFKSWMKGFEKGLDSLDEYYRRLNETGKVIGEVIISGKEYMITYPECGCDLHMSSGLDSVALCECSRQSILFVEQSVTNKIITVERLESVLASGEVCKFRVRFEDGN